MSNIQKLTFGAFQVTRCRGSGVWRLVTDRKTLFVWNLRRKLGSCKSSWLHAPCSVIREVQNIENVCKKSLQPGDQHLASVMISCLEHWDGQGPSLLISNYMVVDVINFSLSVSVFLCILVIREKRALPGIYKQHLNFNRKIDVILFLLLLLYVWVTNLKE